MSSATGVQTVAAAPKTQSSSPAVALETIAHELRQPLSAIESIAYYLSLVLPRDGGPAREQAGRLQQLVEQSNWILTSALQLADPAALAPQPVNLEELITQTVTARAGTTTPLSAWNWPADCRWCVSIPAAGGLCWKICWCCSGRCRAICIRFASPHRRGRAGLCWKWPLLCPGYRSGVRWGGVRAEYRERAPHCRGARRDLQHPRGRREWDQSQGGATMKFPLHGSGSPRYSR